jgi:hypothetical protein
MKKMSVKNVNIELALLFANNWHYYHFCFSKQKQIEI